MLLAVFAIFQEWERENHSGGAMPKSFCVKLTKIQK
jgi:hypothetical protein